MVSLTLANRALFAAVALLILLVSSAQCEVKIETHARCTR